MMIYLLMQMLKYILFLLQLSDWDRFAAEEYELLVAEESGNEQSEQV